MKRIPGKFVAVLLAVFFLLSLPASIRAWEVSVSSGLSDRELIDVHESELNDESAHDNSLVHDKDSVSDNGSVHENEVIDKNEVSESIKDDETAGGADLREPLANDEISNDDSSDVDKEESADTSDDHQVEGDFIVQGDTVYGLSEQGLVTLRQNGGVLTLPSNKSRVGSFAFTSNKSVRISEYADRPGVNGVIDKNDVDGNQIHAVGVDFSDNLIREVIIPEGYVYLGSDAFAFNKLLHSVQLASTIERMSDYCFGHNSIDSLVLPSSLKTLGDMVFFDNKLQDKLEIPASVQDLGERTFKSNRISEVVFLGNGLTELKEAVFEDNQIQEVTVPDSIAKISSDAFNGNLGSKDYGGKVVIHTKSNNVNNLPDGPNYYVDPSEDKRTTPIEIDYKQWTEADFTYDGDTVTGFSDIGKLKVKQNKELVIPDKHGEVVIKKIGNDAFRNVSLADSALRKYDLTQITLPATIEEIGDFAFQSNNLTELLLDPDDALKHIGAGAFMNNQIEMLSLPPGVQYIGDAAFHINKINFALIPRDTTYLGRSAFRQNTLELGMGFEEDAKLERIEELAFAECNLQMADLSNAKKLNSIGVQAFADNQLANIEFPEGLKTIEAQVFAKNNLTELALPNSIESIAFNAFDLNPGKSEHGDKVLISIKEPQAKLADGDNFVINPGVTTDDLSVVNSALAKLKAVDKATLRESTANLIDELIKEGEQLATKGKLTPFDMRRYDFKVNFFLSRLELDRVLNEAEKTLAKDTIQPEERKLLTERLDYAKKHFNNSAWSAERLARVTKEVKNLTDLALKRGIGQAIKTQGVYYLESSLPIPPYYIGLDVYFDKDGKILFVYDRSYSIGEGQTNEYGTPIENVDEDNEGYHELALATLDDYEGLRAIDIENNGLSHFSSIREIEKAPEHRFGIFMAVKDAVSDFLKLDINTDVDETTDNTTVAPTTTVSSELTKPSQTKPSELPKPTPSMPSTTTEFVETKPTESNSLVTTKQTQVVVPAASDVSKPTTDSQSLTNSDAISEAKLPRTGEPIVMLAPLLLLLLVGMVCLRRRINY